MPELVNRIDENGSGNGQNKANLVEKRRLYPHCFKCACYVIFSQIHSFLMIPTGRR